MEPLSCYGYHFSVLESCLSQSKRICRRIFGAFGDELTFLENESLLPERIVSFVDAGWVDAGTDASLL